jgi:hypothetical protein
MIAWTEEELGRIGEAQELQLTSERPDGTFRPYVTMWVVRVDDQLYVRSAYGPDNPWFRRAKASGGAASTEAGIGWTRASRQSDAGVAGLPTARSEWPIEFLYPQAG